MTTPTQTLIDALKGVIDTWQPAAEPARRPVKDRAEADAAPEWRILDPSELAAATEARVGGEVRMKFSIFTNGSGLVDYSHPEFTALRSSEPAYFYVSPATWQPPATERVDVLDALRDGRAIDGEETWTIAGAGTADAAELHAINDWGGCIAEVAADGTVEVDRVQP